MPLAKHIFVINDKGLHARSILLDLEELQCGSELILHETVDDFFNDLAARVAEDHFPRRCGVVLDIIFPDESQGGMHLWERLEAAAIDSLFGPVLVLSNTDDEEDVVFKYFQSRKALISSATSAPLERKRMLTMLINRIP